jgi:hypothetical protein
MRTFWKKRRRSGSANETGNRGSRNGGIEQNAEGEIPRKRGMG